MAGDGVCAPASCVPVEGFVGPLIMVLLMGAIPRAGVVTGAAVVFVFIIGYSRTFSNSIQSETYNKQGDDGLVWFHHSSDFIKMSVFCLSVCNYSKFYKLGVCYKCSIFDAPLQSFSILC